LTRGLATEVGRRQAIWRWANLWNVILSPCNALALLVWWQEGHWACKKWVLVCWCWWFDWNFAHLI